MIRDFPSVRLKTKSILDRKLEPWCSDRTGHQTAKPKKLYPSPKRLLDTRHHYAARCKNERYSMKQERAPLESSPRSKAAARKKPPVRVVEKFLLCREDAAHVLSISLRALDYLIANKILPIRRIGTRVLIPLAALGQFARGDHPQRVAGWCIGSGVPAPSAYSRFC